ncbi:hypothetical protein [Sulfurospirillum deleyianum]|uniref:Nucleic acid binding OB-fold tRNA/helicase-type n=1 Tax=Sulfurospirillum deleyianum (strain ATCC 51133 / DSM 6946 / 5175) TaxID=525898 RepID=D1B0X4_SULD5|nr:hypothetical protein [Sulfurospirillum deleyianum]ACZ11744.1 conserved hypothetical protein [Sulfurospirillum deleyianum DSM 6946]
MKRITTLLVSLACSISLYAGDLHEGVIKDVIHGGGYTYLEIEDAKKSYWIAVEGVDIPKGLEVRFQEEMRAKDFHSKSLNRTFDELMFASNLQHRTNVSEKGNLELITAVVEHSPYQKEGSMSVKEVLQKRPTLSGKSVSVSGKVVKASQNIMGRNWVHIQDGTGEGGEVGRVVFTSKELPKVGDIVTAQGVVAIDKDFGSGYIYKIIVENATFRQ